MLKEFKVVTVVMLLLSVLMGCGSDSNKQGKEEQEKITEARPYKFVVENSSEEMQMFLNNMNDMDTKYLKEDDGFKVTINKTQIFYIGELKDNMPHGVGSISVKPKESFRISGMNPITMYVGSFKEGKFDGYGLYYQHLAEGELKYFNDSSFLPYIPHLRYQGYFVEGKRTGKGNLFRPDSSQSSPYIDKLYEVMERAGNGEKVTSLPEFPIYQSYSGELKKNKLTGEGTLYYSNGNMKYDGQLRKGKYNGEGKLYNENGQLVYNGEFILGNYYGEGTLYSDSGNKLYVGVLPHRHQAKEFKLINIRIIHDNFLSYIDLFRLFNVDLKF